MAPNISPPPACSLSGSLCEPQFLGPSISNKQRIQRWITVGVKSIAAGLPGTAIDYESVLVSRAPWWRKGEGRQQKRGESEKGRKILIMIHRAVPLSWIYRVWTIGNFCCEVNQEFGIKVLHESKSVDSVNIVGSSDIVTLTRFLWWLTLS